MHHYKISEFAAMVGLPQSKIRFYEKYGLFEVKRSKNGYRYYTPEDAFRVNAFRTLLQYGFTVEQSIEMLEQKQSGDVFSNSLKAQKDHLNQEIERAKYRLQRLDAAIDLINSEPCSGFQIADSADYLYVHSSYGRDFSVSIENEDLIACFVDLLPISSYARIISPEDFDRPGDTVNPNYITALPVTESHLIPDPDDSRIHRLNMGKCLFFRRRATRIQSAKKATFEDAFSYIDTHGYQVRGHIVIFPSFLNLDGNGQDIESVLIPVR